MGLGIVAFCPPQMLNKGLKMMKFNKCENFGGQGCSPYGTNISKDKQ